MTMMVAEPGTMYAALIIIRHDVVRVWKIALIFIVLLSRDTPTNMHLMFLQFSFNESIRRSHMHAFSANAYD